MSFYVKAIKGIEDTGSMMTLELLQDEKYDSLEEASEHFSSMFNHCIERLEDEIEDWECYPTEHEVELPGEEEKVYSQFIRIQNTLKRIFFHVLLVPETFNNGLNAELKELTELN